MPLPAVPSDDGTLQIVDRASVSIAREHVRAVAHLAGLSVEAAERLALAVSELAQNQLDHAAGGRMKARVIERDGVPGVEIVASDVGPGLPDPAGALDGTAPARGLGAGFGSVRRMVEELDLDTRAGEGTTVVGRSFARSVARQPEVAVLGRGVESPSGDVAVVRRTADALVLAVIDGSGHGAQAREVADLAARSVVSGRSLSAIVAAMDEALRGTRGAAVTLALIDRARAVTLLGVGNVAAAVVGPAGVQRYPPQSGVLGRRHRAVSSERTFALPSHGSLLLWTDGIASDVALREVVGRSPIHVAQQVLTAHGKAHDDALVLVAR